MIKKQSQVSPTQLELHSPFQTNENSSEIEKDWVKETEEQIESLQTRTSAVLQSLNFIFRIYLYFEIYAMLQNLQKIMKLFGNNSVKKFLN